MPSLLTHPLPPTFLGLASHNLIFKHSEWHLHVPHILLSHLLFFLSIYFLHTLTPSFTSNNSITASISPTAKFCSLYLLGLYSSMVIYRLFFHKTRRFRGPRLASVTKLWHVWRCRGSENFRVMRRVWRDYGDVVRTGPNEITLFTPDAIHLLDGPKNTNTRDIWYDILHPRKALVFARNPDEIRALRGSWSQGVSSKCLAAYTPRLLLLTQTLSTLISSSPNTPLNINDLMSRFAFDAMGAITFGRDFSMLSTGHSQTALTNQRKALALIAPLNDASWIAHAGIRMLPWVGAVRGWWAAVGFCEARMRERMLENTDRVDMAKFFIHEYHNSSTTHTPSYRHNVLMGNSISAIVAGSDTTRAALIAIFYYLCKHPRHIQKIHTEVQGIDIDDSQKLASLEHLNAVIKETLRLAPPAMTGSSRITGREGLWVGGRWVPGGVKVTAPKFVVQRLPSAFVEPDEFIPERWTTRKELVLDARAYAPFSVGPHQCIGKAISQLEMRFVTARLVKMFHVEFSPEHDPEAFWKYMKDQVTMMPGDLYCCFRPRELEG